MTEPGSGGGFKIADAFVNITARDSTSQGVTQAANKVGSSLQQTTQVVRNSVQAVFRGLETSANPIIGNIAEITSGFSGMGLAGEEAGSRVGRTLTNIGSAGLVAGSGLLLLGAQGKQAEDQLANAIQNTGHSFDDYKDQIDKTIKTQEGFGHTAIQTENALQTLTNATHDPAKAISLMGEAADLAASRHISLQSAASLVARALGGSGRVFQQYGITVKKNADGTKDFAGANEQLAKVLSGQASAASDNFGGHLRALGATIEDDAEKFSKFAPAVVGVSAAFTLFGNIKTKVDERSAASAATAATAQAAADAEIVAGQEATTAAIVAGSASMDAAIGSIGPSGELTAAQYVAASAEIEAAQAAMVAQTEVAATAFDTAMASEATAATELGAAGARGAAGLALLTTGASGVGFALTAAAAATFGLSKLFDALNASDEKVVTSTKNLGQVLRDNGGAFDDQAKKALASALSQGDFIDKAGKAGVSAKELTNGITGNDQAFDAMIKKWKEGGKPANDTIYRIEQMHKSFQKNTEQGQKNADALREVTDATSGMSTGLDAGSIAIAKQDKFLKDNNLTIDQAKKKYNDAVTAAHSFTAQLGYMSDALDQVSGNAISAELDQEKLTDAVGNAGDSFKGARAQVDAHGHSLNINTDDGRANREWALQQIQAINQQAVAYAKSTGSIGKGTQALGTNEAALRTSMYQAGFTKTEVDKLLATYAATPGDIKTIVEQKGAQAVIDKLGEIENDLHRIADPQWAAKVDFAYNNPSLARGRATGGLIQGPGGPTDDAVPFWGSNGEYIVNAAATNKWLPLLENINKGVKGFAGGGLLGSLRLNLNTGAVPDLLGFANRMAPPSPIGVPGNFSGSVLDWVFAAENATGTPASWTAPILRRINFESGGNPNAQNNWDSNAMAGDPSRGLMQTIMSTFLAYHQAGTSMNIFDPVANISAAINYIKSRYGSIFAIDPPIQGYDEGGPLPPGKTTIENRTGDYEYVFNQKQMGIHNHFAAGAIIIDAKNVKEFNDVVRIIHGIPQAVRAM